MEVLNSKQFLNEVSVLCNIKLAYEHGSSEEKSQAIADLLVKNPNDPIKYAVTIFCKKVKIVHPISQKTYTFEPGVGKSENIARTRAGDHARRDILDMIFGKKEEEEEEVEEEIIYEEESASAVIVPEPAFQKPEIEESEVKYSIFGRRLKSKQNKDTDTKKPSLHIDISPTTSSFSIKEQTPGKYHALQDQMPRHAIEWIYTNHGKAALYDRNFAILYVHDEVDETINLVTWGMSTNVAKRELADESGNTILYGTRRDYGEYLNETSAVGMLKKAVTKYLLEEIENLENGRHSKLLCRKEGEAMFTYRKNKSFHILLSYLDEDMQEMIYSENYSADKLKNILNVEAKFKEYAKRYFPYPNFHSSFHSDFDKLSLYQLTGLQCIV